MLFCSKLPLNLFLTKFELNQCVIEHLAFPLDWWLNGKRFRIPARPRVDLLASALRASEYVQAQMCFEHIKKPNTLLEHEVWSALHVAMNICHGGSFKRTGWLFTTSFPSDVNLRIRIYDYEELADSQKVTVYRYDSGTSPVLPNEAINLIVTYNHIRFLLRSNETFP